MRRIGKILVAACVCAKRCQGVDVGDDDSDDIHEGFITGMDTSDATYKFDMIGKTRFQNANYAPNIFLSAKKKIAKNKKCVCIQCGSIEFAFHSDQINKIKMLKNIL